MSEIKNTFYKTFPKTCKQNDFWGQVKRTVNGKPVDQEQIDMIIHAIKSGLSLNSEDTLLDLCCGNGALSILLANSCNHSLGVDFSEPLIHVAKKHFEDKMKIKFKLQDVVDFTASEENTECYTKTFCYGSFQYLSINDGYSLLKNIRSRFQNIEYFFIGNVPDKDKTDMFYREKIDELQLTDPRTEIGVWRSKAEFQKLAHQTGWEITFTQMPENFYSGHYRYDALLSPRAFL